MEINVSQQLKSHIGSEREYEVSESIDILGTGTGNPVEGKVTLIRTNRGILVRGKLTSKIPLECSRCLKIFEYPLSFEIEEEYFPLIDVNTGTPLEIPDEESSFIIDEHHILDLKEAIRQNALLAIPMKPLCRKDCAGICQQCGKDLNQGPCDCEQEGIDPRWSKLINLVAEVRKKKK